MDKSNAKQILESRSVISKTGKFTLRVTNVTYGHQRLNKDGSTTTVDIVNFNAMTAFQAQQAVEAFKQGEYEEATRRSLSTSLLNGMYVPTKGEIVDVEIEEIYSDKAEANILVVQSVIKRQAESTSKFSLDALEEEVEAPAKEAKLV